MFKLISETDSHWNVAHPSGKKISIPKTGCDPLVAAAVRHLPKAYAEGGEIMPGSSEGGWAEGTQVERDVGEQPLLRQGPFSYEPMKPTAAFIPGKAWVPNRFQNTSEPESRSEEASAETTTPPVDAMQEQSMLRNYKEQATVQPSEFSQAPENMVSRRQSALARQQMEMGQAIAGPGAALSELDRAAQAMHRSAIQSADPFWAEAHEANKKSMDVIEGLQKNFSEDFNNIKTEMQQRKIDPMRAWHDRSTPQKIAGVIGMILGGVASHWTGGNQALNVIMKQIDNDILAQKATMEQKDNLYGLMFKKYGNDLQATSALRTLKLAAVDTHLADIERQYAGSKAGLEAQKMRVGLEQSLVPVRAQLSQAKAEREFRMQMLDQYSDPKNAEASGYVASPHTQAVIMAKDPFDAESKSRVSWQSGGKQYFSHVPENVSKDLNQRLSVLDVQEQLFQEAKRLTEDVARGIPLTEANARWKNIAMQIGLRSPDVATGSNRFNTAEMNAASKWLLGSDFRNIFQDRARVEQSLQTLMHDRMAALRSNGIQFVDPRSLYRPAQ